jgi:hypothetical protein
MAALRYHALHGAVPTRNILDATHWNQTPPCDVRRQVFPNGIGPVAPPPAARIALLFSFLQH